MIKTKRKTSYFYTKIRVSFIVFILYKLSIEKASLYYNTKLS